MEEEKILTEEEQKKLFIECLEHSVGGSVGFFLTETRLENGVCLGEAEISKKITNKTFPLIRVGGDYIFLDIEFPKNDDLDLKSAMYMWEQYLNRSTEAYRSTGSIQIVPMFIIDVVGVAEKVTYTMEFINPVFCFRSENKMSLSMPIENLLCTKSEADDGDAEKEKERYLAESFGE